MSNRAATVTRRRNPADIRANWRTAPVLGKIVRQSSEILCGPACAEMLFYDRGFLIGQALIAQGLNCPVMGEHLASRMDQLSPLRWDGGSLPIKPTEREIFAVLKKQCDNGSWMSLLEFDADDRIGHWVVVDAVSRTLVAVRDPAASAFYIPLHEFTRYWNSVCVVVEV